MASITKGVIATIKFYPEMQVQNICIVDTATNITQENNKAFDHVLYISPYSPVAKAMLDRKEGERVTFTAPSGTKELEVIRVIPHIPSAI